MWLVLADHVESVSHYFLLDGKEALWVEDEEVSVVDGVVLCAGLLQPKWHLLSFLGEAFIQVEGRTEDLFVVVVLVEQLEVRLHLIWPRKGLFQVCKVVP